MSEVDASGRAPADRPQDMPTTADETTPALTDDEKRNNGWVDYLAKGGLLLAVTLVTALLATIGINQDLLARLLRNDPQALTYAIWLAILGVSIPVIGYLFASSRALGKWPDNEASETTNGGLRHPSRALKEWSRNPNRIKATCAALGAIFLIISAMDTMYHGVRSFGEREQPSVHIVVTGDGSNEKAKVIASAQSLKTSEHFYLRIIAFDEAHTSEVNKACSNALTDVPAGARVLYWGQSGAVDPKGKAAAEVDVNVNRREFPFLCAHAIITDPNRLTSTTASPSIYPGSATCPSAPAASEPGVSPAPTGSVSTTAASPPATACSQVPPVKILIRQGDRFSSVFIDLRNAPVTAEPTESTPVAPASQPSRSG